MMRMTPFFHIPLHILLSKKGAYPFQVYLFNPRLVGHQLFLKANTPLTNKALEQLYPALREHQEIAVKLSQRETFLRFFDLKAEQVLELKVDTKKLHQRRIQKYRELHPNCDLITPEDLEEAKEEFYFANDPLHLYQLMALEVAELPPGTAPWIAFAQRLVAAHIGVDSPITRQVILNYFLCKRNKIEGPEILSQMVIASFFQNLHLAQYTKEQRRQTPHPLDQGHYASAWLGQMLERTSSIPPQLLRGECPEHPRGGFLLDLLRFTQFLGHQTFEQGLAQTLTHFKDPSPPAAGNLTLLHRRGAWRDLLEEFTPQKNSSREVA